MNIDKELHGLMTINGESQTLGYATYDELVMRSITHFKRTKAKNSKYSITIEISESPINGDSEKSQLARAEAEFNSMHATPEELAEEMYPGWTATQVLTAMETKEFQDYRFFANDPAKRIGADEQIKAAKQAFESKFPGLIHHCPPWIDAR